MNLIDQAVVHSCQGGLALAHAGLWLKKAINNENVKWAAVSLTK